MTMGRTLYMRSFSKPPKWYANQGDSVSPLMLDHYREMTASGAAMIVVEHKESTRPGWDLHSCCESTTIGTLKALLNSQIQSKIKGEFHFFRLIVRVGMHTLSISKGF